MTVSLLSGFYTLYGLGPFSKCQIYHPAGKKSDQRVITLLKKPQYLSSCHKQTSYDPALTVIFQSLTLSTVCTIAVLRLPQKVSLFTIYSITELRSDISFKSYNICSTQCFGSLSLCGLKQYVGFSTHCLIYFICSIMLINTNIIFPLYLFFFKKLKRGTYNRSEWM